jgi:hypothetical protein
VEATLPTTTAIEIEIECAARRAPDRLTLWAEVANRLGAGTAAELGVWRGEFAEHLLRQCPFIRAYHLIDPWRHLDEWNKPFNVPDREFEEVMTAALARTAFAAKRRRVWRGTTVEVAPHLANASLDFCYIDGDHTLRGILIDLVNLYPKVKDGGILAGDDFLPTSWQQDDRFEPTLVFPTAVHFAEATGSVIYGLPHGQFALLVDRRRQAFAFHDLTGQYGTRSLAATLRHPQDGGFRGSLTRLWQSLKSRTSHVGEPARR